MSAKWIIIGAAIIVGLNQLLKEVFFVETVLVGFVDAFGQSGAVWLITALIAVGSFFVGGLLIGWLSPGETLKEPAIAATIAIVVNIVLAWVIAETPPDPVGSVIIIAVGYALGLAGAKVGERLQGDTTDKLRERGEL